MLAWLRRVLPGDGPRDYELDRLVPRGEAFDLRIRIRTEDGGRRAVPLRIVPASADVEGSLPLGGWRLVYPDPLRDPRLGVARALARDVMVDAGRWLGCEIRDAALHTYTPGRRAVVRYSAADGSEHFGKLYRAGRSEAVYRASRCLREAGLSDWLSEPVGHRPDLEMIVWRGARGRHLRELYPGDEYRAGLTRAGAALRRLHDTPAKAAPRTLRDELAAAAEHVDRVAAFLERRPADLDEFCCVLTGAADRLDAGPSRTLHGDFHDNQVTVDGARAVLLDLDQIRAGDPAIDVGNFVAHVDFRIAYEQATEDSRPYARAFLAGYGRLDGEGGEDRVAFAHAVSLVRNCCLYVLRPRRREALSHACRRVLDGLDR